MNTQTTEYEQVETILTNVKSKYKARFVICRKNKRKGCLATPEELNTRQGHLPCLLFDFVQVGIIAVPAYTGLDFEEYGLQEADLPILFSNRFEVIFPISFKFMLEVLYLRLKGATLEGNKEMFQL